MYRKYIKMPFDFCIALAAFIVISPLFVFLIIIGALAMKGNPFFTQPRPGKNEKIFKIIKFRTMTNEKDKNGNLLPDEKRLVPYGKFLRSTSLDELPSLINIIVGQMAVVGPRPLKVKYLPLYNEEQKHRHDVRPGLTGYAQVNGRNAITWEEKFKLDVEYVHNITFIGDMKIIFKTVKTVLKREGISSNTSETMEEFTGTKDAKVCTSPQKFTRGYF